MALLADYNGNIDNSNLKALAGILDSKLASPNNSAYKTLLATRAILQTDAFAGSYFLGLAGTSLDPNPTQLVGLTGGNPGPVDAVYLDDADFVVGGLTTKLRVRAQVSTNGTVPAITFTFGLYPLQLSGGADTLIATLGTLVPGSNAPIANPAANGTTTVVSADVNIPADGLYCIGVVTSGALTNNAVCLLSAQLQTRNV